MLKILKINVPVQVKGDPEDPDDIKERVYETLQVGIDNDDLEFTVQDEDSDEDDLEDYV